MKERTYVNRNLVFAGFLAFLFFGVGIIYGHVHTNSDNNAASAPFEFQNVSIEAGLTYSSTGSGIGNGNDGVYVVDFNRDLRMDILLIGGPRPALYRNTGEAFERSDALSQFDAPMQSALFFDANGDSWQDLLLLPRNGTATLLYNQNGTFRVCDCGFNQRLHIPVAATAADFDGDNRSEVVIVQSGDWGDRTPAGYGVSMGEESNGGPNLFFDWNGSAFVSIEDTGIHGTRWSLATSAVDLNSDDRPDIHITNDYDEDVVYINRGNNQFHRVELGMRRTEMEWPQKFSMPLETVNQMYL